MTSRPSTAAPILAALALLLLPLGYVGAYYLLVERVVVRVTFNEPIVGWKYPGGGDINAIVAPLFAPISYIDRTVIRREYWNTPDEIGFFK